MLTNENASRSMLTAEKFLELLEEKKINLPPITKEEILDRSKGDDLSRVIAIVQTIWIIIQFYFRLAQSLMNTELELLTVTVALFSWSFVVFWWKKPLDVRCPIPVSLLVEKNRT